MRQPRKIFYFAYGSNMDFHQMRYRCPSARKIALAKKRGFEICFPIVSGKREGKGVASIQKKHGSEVEGILYEMTLSDFHKLDVFEHYKKKYGRHKIMIEFSGKEKKQAWAYVALDDRGRKFKPSKNYLSIMIESAKANQFSNTYIEKLKSYL